MTLEVTTRIEGRIQMARRRARIRARAAERSAKGGRTTPRARIEGGDGSVVPRVLLGAVDGVETVAVGALQLARDVALSTVSGAANIGAQALTATLAGARGVVSATVDMVGEIAGAAQGTFQATLENARHSRRGPARLAPARSGVHTTDEREAKGASMSSKAARSRRRVRRLRPATRPARPSVAA
jgi:hypothetical protein